MIRVCLLLLAILGTPLRAQVLDDTRMHQAAATLRPGGYAWRDTAVAGQRLTIVVSIALQIAYVYGDGGLLGVASVSTGKPGKATPLGGFTVLQKARFHRSNLYSNAPMPFMQRLTWTGIAMHVGQNPGYPASHGCIRLPAQFARDLFALTTLGTAVTLADYPLQAPVYLELGDFDGDLGPVLTYSIEVFR